MLSSFAQSCSQRSWTFLSYFRGKSANDTADMGCLNTACGCSIPDMDESTLKTYVVLEILALYTNIQTESSGRKETVSVDIKYISRQLTAPAPHSICKVLLTVSLMPPLSDGCLIPKAGEQFPALNTPLQCVHDCILSTSSLSSCSALLVVKPLGLCTSNSCTPCDLHSNIWGLRFPSA